MVIGYDFTIVLQWSIFHCVETQNMILSISFFARDSTVGLNKKREIKFDLMCIGNLICQFVSV
jgi:hypothetical protein